MAGKIWPTIRWGVIRTKWGIKSWLIFTPMAVVHRFAHPYLFLQFLRSPAGNNCLTYPPSNHKHFLHSQKRSAWALHFLFDFTACKQMEPSWGNFFLQLDREVCSWTGILPCRTVFFGHILFRVFWEGKLCEGSHCGVWGRVVSWWARLDKFSTKRECVPFLHYRSLPYWRREKWRSKDAGVNLSLSFEASDEICLCNSAVSCGTILMAGPTL